MRLSGVTREKTKVVKLDITLLRGIAAVGILIDGKDSCAQRRKESTEREGKLDDLDPLLGM